jgi:Family of unknown function (DUF7009)
MKLRIRGNSVRIRVSKGELAQIEVDGAAEDSVQFSPSASLRYRVEVKPTGSVEADFSGPLLRIAVPQAAIERWLEPEEVAIHGQQAVAPGQVLRILVEKDYTCLAPRADEDDTDLFENPLQSAGRD